MSDLDDSLIDVLQNDDLTPDEKLKKIECLFKHNESIKRIVCVDKEEDLINPNHRVTSYTNSLRLEKTAATIAAEKKDHGKILDYLLAQGFGHEQPLFVACVLEDAALARKLIIKYPINLEYKEQHTSRETIENVLKSFLPKLYNAYNQLQLVARLLTSYEQKSSVELKEQKEPSSDAWNKRMQIFEFLLSAWESDRSFVIEYLIARLHDIHNKQLKEANLLYMVSLTRIIHGWVNEKLAQDTVGKDRFQELLMTWAAYTPKSDGFFQTRAALDAFLEEIGADKQLLSKHFTEQTRRSDFQYAIAAVKSPIVSEAISTSALHRRT